MRDPRPAREMSTFLRLALPAWGAGAVILHIFSPAAGQLSGGNGPFSAAGFLQAPPVREIIGTSADRLFFPVDLAFHPRRNEELWVLNQGVPETGGSTVIYFSPGEPGGESRFLQDGNSWHFMATTTSLAFGDNGNFATAQGTKDANRSGGTFCGPTLWPSDLQIYAQVGNPPNRQANGSHIDMIHQSPYGMGIAHDTGNVYWVYDGWNGHITRYDFVRGHQPGGEDHSDGIVRRYAEAAVSMLPGMPSHMEMHGDWLYVADTGNRRILRLDTRSGQVERPLQNWEGLAEYSLMSGAAWEEVVTQGLERPSGLAIAGGFLLVGDNATGEIVLYGLDSPRPSEAGRLRATEPGNLVGLEVGPRGCIWFADPVKGEVGRLAPAGAAIAIRTGSFGKDTGAGRRFRLGIGPASAGSRQAWMPVFPDFRRVDGRRIAAPP